MSSLALSVFLLAVLTGSSAVAAPTLRYTETDLGGGFFDVVFTVVNSFDPVANPSVDLYDIVFDFPVPGFLLSLPSGWTVNPSAPGSSIEAFSAFPGPPQTGTDIVPGQSLGGFEFLFETTLGNIPFTFSFTDPLLPGQPLILSGTSTVVTEPPIISKAFGEVGIGSPASTTLSFTLMNPNQNTTLDELRFSDTLPGGLVVSTPSVATGSCGGGAITAVAHSSTITLGGAVLAPLASCTFSVNVSSDGTVVGYLTNTTGTVSSNETLPGNAAAATIFIGDPFQVNYAANLNIGESYIDITNTGTNGASLLGPGFGAAAGNICVNVYAFDLSEELIACCSCLITPDQTVNLGVNRDLLVKTLTGVVPTSVTIKLLSTLAGGDGTGTSCTNSVATVTSAQLANGMASWGTTLHATPPGGGYATTERAFTGATLSGGELASAGGRCAAILGNGSGFGICASCRAGALGAGKL